MRRFLLIMALMSLLHLHGKADSYTSLWKQVETAASQDLPKTQVELLDKIVSKARQERAYGHLLRASVQRMRVRGEVAPDSLEQDVKRFSESISSEKDEALQAVEWSVLAAIYRMNPTLSDDADQLASDYYSKSLANPKLLAATKSVGYEPLFVKGVDSKVFGDDLLHVLGLEAEQYDLLHDYYDQAGNRPAACLLALQVLRQKRQTLDTEMRKSKYVQALDSLSSRYKDLQECGEVAIERYNFMANSDDATPEEQIQYINYALLNWGSWPRLNILRNAQTRLTLPSFHVKLPQQVALPEVPVKVDVMSITNIQTLTMSVYPVNITGETVVNPSNDTEFARIKPFVSKTAIYSDTRRYVGLPAYKQTRDSLEIKGLPIGVYLVEFTTDNNGVAPERTMLYVTDVYVYYEPILNSSVRLVCVNATTGQPLPKATIKLCKRDYRGNKSGEVTLTTDSNGEAVLTENPNKLNALYAYTSTDKYMPMGDFYAYYHYSNNRQTTTTTRLFTDRAIYRPGQEVQAAVICFESDGAEKVKAVPYQEIKLTLRDANYKEVGSKTVTTDEMGTASAAFTLPANGLTGRFTLQSSVGNTSTSFNVEEYKRPTFQVEFDKVSTDYQEGDTVSVRGVARSYAGVPVQGAKVAVSVKRRQARWCWWVNMDNNTVTILNDTIQTDDEGAFVVSVPMDMPEKWDGKTPRYYTFDVEADVTNLAGESHHGQMELPLSDKPTAFNIVIPDKMRRDMMPEMKFSLQNNAGENVDAEVKFTIDGGAERVVRSNTPLSLQHFSLLSGRHHIEAVCGEDTLSRSFVVFSLDDKRPVIQTDEWFYASASQFPSDGTPVYIQVGATDNDQHIVYNVFAENRVIEQGVIKQSNALATRAFTYKPEYGDGVLVTYAWVKNGKLHRAAFTIEKPLPDKRLTMLWSTFRDRLEPGQKETWQVKITRQDGTPADAQLLAVLYDKSLDQLVAHQWRLNIPLYRHVPSCYWHDLSIRDNGDSYLYGEQTVKLLKEPSLLFTQIDKTIFPYPYVRRVMVRGAGPVRMSKAQAVDEMHLAMPAAINESVVMAYDAKGVDNDAEIVNEEPLNNDSEVQLRENLNETAFFYPTLSTDADGMVQLSFTLPESVTTWRFMGLSHDVQMNNGMLEDEVVASKRLMVQPNMPRFLRHGDKAKIASSVVNTSDQLLSGSALIELIDPETEHILYQQSQLFSVEAGKTTAVIFDIPTDNLIQIVICKVTARSGDFSDGEQHYLSVLPSMELVTNTKGFTQHTQGTLNVDLKSLIAVNDETTRLTIEYTNNPVWLMIQALPSVSTPNNDNAISLSSAFYANSIANNIIHQSPDILPVLEQWRQETSDETSLMSSLEKNESLKAVALNETPWVLDAEKEADQKRMLANYFDETTINYRLKDQFSKLKNLQLSDGSFAWWPGMKGSWFVTTTVAKDLVRLAHMTEVDAQTTSLAADALKYLGKKVTEEVNWLKEQEAKGKKDLLPSDLTLDFLYCLALSDIEPKTISKSDIKYLVKLLATKTTELTIYGKAGSAIILSHFNEQQRAAEYMESLRQYMVYTEEMGRYFDSPRATYSWRDYRIPSQVAAIEAVKLLTPNDKTTKEELQRWLLQEKRTQSWDTPINSVEAIYAFLDGESQKLTTDPTQATTLAIDGKQLTLPAAMAGLGYVKTAVAGKDCSTLTANKTSEGTSWGAVYAQFMQPSADISAASSGLTVEREVIPADKKKGQLTVGDRVTVRITIKADRDYDFVEVIDKRPACLEPMGQISGYHWGYYCTPRDNSTNYYFDCLAKGKHVVETTYYIDRAGDYASGTCVAQCAYSPEYSGRASGMMMSVKEK